MISPFLGTAGLRTEGRMRVRPVVAAVVIASAAVAPTATSGQETAPRTPWGPSRPAGAYTNKTITPLQRPAEFAGRELLTAAEMANLQREAADRNAELLTRPAAADRGDRQPQRRRGRRARLLQQLLAGRGHDVDRPDLHHRRPARRPAPALTTEARQDEEARLAARNARGPADTWTDLDLNDRCMLWSVGPPMLPPLQQLLPDPADAWTTLPSMSR